MRYRAFSSPIASARTSCTDGASASRFVRSTSAFDAGTLPSSRSTRLGRTAFILENGRAISGSEKGRMSILFYLYREHVALPQQSSSYNSQRCENCEGCEERTDCSKWVFESLRKCSNRSR